MSFLRRLFCRHHWLTVMDQFSFQPVNRVCQKCGKKQSRYSA